MAGNPKSAAFRTRFDRDSESGGPSGLRMGKSRGSRSRPLLADVPVEQSKDDQLGRSPFARNMAKTITSMKGTDSFVFGLCGPWGSGKSSALKLVLEALGTGRAKNKPLIVK